ncbi:MAG: excinuclease ABC subunit C [Flavobacteriales bacterium]|jgi:excinuclease ABC subunit C
MSASDHLKEIIKVLPTSPGVYQYFDAHGKIIYVGKAINLRSRVSSYFNKSAQHSGKTQILVKQIVDLKTIKVPTEMDALLLENSLIKKHQPKYNIQLKDDKTYPWICIPNEPFPRVFYSRRVIKNGSEYFGPFSNVKMIKTLIALFNRSFNIRHCNHKLKEETIGSNEYLTSVEYYIGNCKGCCQGETSKEEYEERLNNVRGILKGNTKNVISDLKAKMQTLAAEMEFEKAQELKERLELVEKYQAKSTVVSASLHNLDVFSIDADDNNAYINFIKVMSGAIIQSHTIEIKKKLNESNSEVLAFAVLVIREKFPSESKEILLSEPTELQLEGVKFSVPQKGEKKSLIDLSQRNAMFYKVEKYKHIKNTDPDKHVSRIMQTMQKDLRMTEPPVHIECFDNSNFHGTNAVAACVVFKNGKPSKKEYRNFNIKTVEGSDDFASMEEVVYRRYKRLQDEKEPLPQLIVIDGGKGQLSSAVKSLRKLNLFGKIAIIGIAKRLEEIYFPGDSTPIYLDKRSESLKVIQNARNEAHRFGITHHRNKRSKNFIQSELLGIKGIGDKTQLQLIKDFKSVSLIKAATFSDWVASIGLAKAQILKKAWAED